MPKSSLTLEDMMDLAGDLEEMSTEELQDLVEQLTKMQNQAAEQSDYITQLEFDSLTDTLTGLSNHRMVEKEMHRAIAIAERYKRSHAFILLQIDDFASTQSHFGKSAADNVLCHIANLLKQNTRPTDVVGRYDTSVFCVLMTEVNTKEDATRRADELSAVINATPCIGASSTIQVQTGVGCHYFGAGEEVQEIINKARTDMVNRLSPSATQVS